MTVHWTLRSAEPSDAQRLALIGAATFLDTFAGALDGDAIVEQCRVAHSAEGYSTAIEGGASAWLGEAAVGGAPLGFALAAPSTLPGCEAGDYELKRIYVLSRAHGTGLGRALMDRAIAHARDAGYRRLALGVYRHNAKAHAFYAKAGFEQVGERQFRVGHNVYDDWVFARDLR